MQYGYSNTPKLLIQRQQCRDDVLCVYENNRYIDVYTLSLALSFRKWG